MYTSANILKKHLIFNLAGTLFLALFGAIYETFSHGVFSFYMIYAFAFPLVLGVTLYLILLFVRKYPNRVFLNLWNSAIAAFSVGSVFQGVLEIYGTTNSLSVVYPAVGGILAASALASLAVTSLRKHTNSGVSKYDSTI